MAYNHISLNLTGAAQQLIANITAAQNIPIREITFQADGANGGAIFVGDADVSTTDYGFRIPAAAAGVPSPPIILGGYSSSGPMKLGDFWVVGSLNEDLHVSYVPF